MRTHQILHRMRRNRDSSGERLSSMSSVDPDDNEAVFVEHYLTVTVCGLF